MTTFSLCMIVKDEEEVLSRCLNSLCDIMDEIIIVDTGSTDRTKEIAKKYTDKVFDYNGAMILQMQEILRHQRQLVIIFIQQMQMNIWIMKTKKSFVS